jgi:hypothetical protein
LGSTSNSLITVGGVREEGKLWPDTTPQEPGEAGSISIYAAAREVLLADFRSDDGTHRESGTSFAAPAIAGLTAVFFSTPNLDNIWTPGSVGLAVKEFFSFTANLQRNNNPIPPEVDYTPPDPASVVVGWNGQPNGYASPF